MSKTLLTPALIAALAAMTACGPEPSETITADEIAAAPSAWEGGATGTFTGVNSHEVAGTITIEQRADGWYAVLGDDFSLDDAPDAYLGFGSGGAYADGTNFEFLEKEDYTGAQEYKLPDDLDPTKFDQFVIWCKEFSVLLGTADIG
ncbi:MAG: DM13 domain-containing protein [Pseudomonadota bacterium]